MKIRSKIGYNEFRERATDITISLDENLEYGLERFFEMFKKNFHRFNPPGTLDGLVYGILDITRDETHQQEFDKVLRMLYED